MTPVVVDRIWPVLVVGLAEGINWGALRPFRVPYRSQMMWWHQTAQACGRSRRGSCLTRAMCARAFAVPSLWLWLLEPQAALGQQFKATALLIAFDVHPPNSS